MTTNKEKDSREEAFTESLTYLPTQYNNPTWLALKLAFDSGELDIHSYTQLCSDFGFLVF